MQGPCLASHNYVNRYVALQGLLNMLSTYPQTLLPAYLLFLIYDVQEPSGLTTKMAASPQAVFRVTPKEFLTMSILYTLGGIAVNFLRELFLPCGPSLFEDRAARCLRRWRGLYAEGSLL